MRLDAHLVAMCDRSSGANDGLPEASSIRPGLAGLPASGTKRDALWVGAASSRIPTLGCGTTARHSTGWDELRQAIADLLTHTHTHTLLSRLSQLTSY